MTWQFAMYSYSKNEVLNMRHHIFIVDWEILPHGPGPPTQKSVATRLPVRQEAMARRIAEKAMLMECRVQVIAWGMVKSPRQRLMQGHGKGGRRMEHWA